MLNQTLEIISADIKFPSPFTHRVLILAQEKKLAYQIIPINVFEKPTWFLDIAPLGQVPVLRMGEVIIPDSRAIIEYLDSLNEPRFIPEDPITHAQQFSWLAFADEIAQEITQLIKNKKAEIRDLRRLNNLLLILEKNLQGQYFYGSKFTLVDIALISHLLWLNALELAVLPFTLLRQYPQICNWLHAMQERPSVALTAGPEYNQQLIGLFEQRQLLSQFYA